MTQQLPRETGTRPAGISTAVKRPKRISSILAAAGIFLLMLAFNLLTDRLVDDYTYSFSFVDGSPIESVGDIFPSIAAHAVKMNGRHIAHFFAQLFLLAPAILFKLINPIVFVLLIRMMAKIADRECPLWLMLAAFALTWIFEPAFGQVNLWLDGACNYLWGHAVCLGWLMPYIAAADKRWSRYPIGWRLAVIPLGFLAGGWNENVSAATIFMAGLLILVTLYEHRHISAELPISLGMALIGFLTMALAPAESQNKLIALTFDVLRGNIVAATEQLAGFGWLILLFALLFAAALFAGGRLARLRLAGILALGALASNYIMIFAAYYHDRSAAYSAILFACGCLVLLSELAACKKEMLVGCVVALLIPILAYWLILGADDIVNTHKIAAANEAYLIASAEAGEREATLRPIPAATKYSAVWDLKYIDTESPDTWPNRNMARWYGLDAIYGTE